MVLKTGSDLDPVSSWTKAPYTGALPKLVGVQAGSVALAVISLVIFVGAKQGLSGFWGGLVVVLPNAWFAWVAGKTANAARVVFLALVKFLVVLVGLGLILAFVDIEALGFFLVLGVALLIQIIGPLIDTVTSLSKRKARA